ncbi:hypothetical protein ACQCU1_09030 [Sutcliffiella horikoshii]|uniref:Uncharacterized protein n=1 Tax=Sutcliffiella horikoshii TaxID=79883 RepID=A0AA94WUC4_9BACI|nr:hypothetical protein [Sutcliffiella horikoshii]TYS61110.1 hypothetical protein FZC74_02210 [Sutcliffiella horikoshii]
MGLYYDKGMDSGCCSWKKNDKGDQNCFCGRYTESFINQFVTVEYIGGPGGGRARTGTLLDFKKKSGILILAVPADPEEEEPAQTLHICCKAVTSISQAQTLPA